MGGERRVMETIVVPCAETNSHTEYKAFQEEWCSKIKDAFGIDLDSVYKGREYAWHEGVLYSRSIRVEADVLFSSVAYYNAKESDAPEVLCPCGSVAFTLRYGSYEIKARCVDCGTEEVLSLIHI